MNTLQKRFHIAKTSLEKGLEELRRYELIQVDYSVSPRWPSKLQKKWQLRPFYNPKEIEGQIKRVSRKHSSRKAKQIRHYAHLIYSGYDPEKISQLLVLYDRYGESKFRKAMAEITQEPYHSQKRSLEYTIALLQDLSFSP